MLETIRLLVLLLAVVAAVAVLASRLKTPPAILLVITGVALALTPGLPRLELSPDVVLLIVLPPLIYSAAVRMSWREFRLNLPPIALLAVGGVVFTTLAVAAATHWLLGFSWPLGILAGAIVSPPDALAPLSIARQLHLPRRLAAILEGEGLANDAAALVLYRFAVAAVSVGGFSVSQASGTFAAIVVGEALWGAAVGWTMLRLRRWTADPSIEILLSVLTPFIAYWPPEQVGGSGVLAAVAAGLYVSWNGPRLIGATTRIQGVFFWRVLTYLIEAMVFLATGLQAHRLIAATGLYPASELALSAGLVTAVVIVARFVWIFPATYPPRWLIPPIRRKDPTPPWQEPFLLSFTGIRGVVSLAAALAIPDLTQAGDPFPHRDLILFLTFCVILVTLVGQGLMLPGVIGWLGLAKIGRQEARDALTEETVARRLGLEASAARLEQLAAKHRLSDEMLKPLQAQIQSRRQALNRQAGRLPVGADAARLHDDIALALVVAERQAVNALARQGQLQDPQRLLIERELDLREAQIANLRGDT